MGLAGIFDHEQIVFCRKLKDRIHIRGLAVKVDRDNTGHSSFRRAIDQFSDSAIEFTSPLNELEERFRIHRIALFIDIHKSDMRTGLGDRFRRRNERVWNSEDDVPGFDPRRHEREAECVRTAIHANTILRVTKSSELAFEFFHHWPADEAGVAKNLLSDRE